MEQWNAWRKSAEGKHGPLPDFADAELTGLNIREANLNGMSFRGAMLAGNAFEACSLVEADFHRADLRDVSFENACLVRANLDGAIADRASFAESVLCGASLKRLSARSANFSFANCSQSGFWWADRIGGLSYGIGGGPTDLTSADLRGSLWSGARLDESILHDVDLSGAQIYETSLVKTELAGASFLGASMSQCVLASELSGIIGLDSVEHHRPSHLVPQADTYKLPDEFLRGCGLLQWEILSYSLHDPTLTPEEVAERQVAIFTARCSKPIQYRPVFISYSHADSEFVDLLQHRLYEAGVNVWRDVHDAPAGPLEGIVHAAMKDRLVLLVLSRNSTKSDWVEHEVRHARALAKEQKRHVILPVALDSTWASCSWLERVKEQIQDYNILDLSNWKHEPSLIRQTDRLLGGIRRWYQ